MFWNDHCYKLFYCRSGKSTYLQQVCLIVILAQIGCYVPARFATLRVVDRIFTRMGTMDSLESNSSTVILQLLIKCCPFLYVSIWIMTLWHALHPLSPKKIEMKKGKKGKQKEKEKNAANIRDFPNKCGRVFRLFIYFNGDDSFLISYLVLPYS